MKVNSIINTNFRGILDSSKPISGKYLQAIKPLTSNTQYLGKIYNGKEAIGTPYIHYVQCLYPTYVLKDGKYEFCATYVPFSEGRELTNEARVLKKSIKTVLKTCETHGAEAKEIRQQLLDEFDKVSIDMVSDSDLAFKTTNVETNRATLVIPSEDGEKLFDIYEFDSLGSLERSLKGVKYFPDNKYTAQEIHIFDTNGYACLKNAIVQNGVIDCEHAYSFDAFENNKFNYSYRQTRKDNATLSQYFVEFENGKAKSYNVDVAIFPNEDFSSSKRYEFYSKNNYSCLYGYDKAKSNLMAEKIFFFENDKLSKIESSCKQRNGELRGNRIIFINRSKISKP